MRFNRIISSLLCAVLILSVVLFSPASQESFQVYAAPDLKDLQEQYDQLEKEQKALEAKLSGLKKNKEEKLLYAQTLRDKVAALDEQLNVICSQIDELNAQLDELKKNIEELEKSIALIEEDIVAKEAEIARQNQEIEETYAIFEQRLRAIYISGDTSNLEVLLGSKDFSDFLSRIELLKGVAKHDTELLDSLEKALKELRENKAALEKSVEQLRQDKAKLDEEKAELDVKMAALEVSKKEADEKQDSYLADLDELQAVLEGISAEEQKYVEFIGEKEEEMDAVDEEIKDYIRKHSDSGSGQLSGKMLWPIQGRASRITSYYGPRWGKVHRGIDISGPNIYGYPISVAEDGVVILAARNHYSYGNYVIVSHGNGVATLYAHCSALLVSGGERVERGDHIAKVGSTGNSTGPHVHFEVRVNGDRIDPLPYLR